jgi:hypothetical protein
MFEFPQDFQLNQTESFIITAVQFKEGSHRMFKMKFKIAVLIFCINSTGTHFYGNHMVYSSLSVDFNEIWQFK